MNNIRNQSILDIESSQTYKIKQKAYIKFKKYEAVEDKTCNILRKIKTKKRIEINFKRKNSPDWYRCKGKQRYSGKIPINEKKKYVMSMEPGFDPESQDAD